MSRVLNKKLSKLINKVSDTADDTRDFSELSLNEKLDSIVKSIDVINDIPKDVFNKYTPKKVVRVEWKDITTLLPSSEVELLFLLVLTDILIKALMLYRENVIKLSFKLMNEYFALNKTGDKPELIFNYSLFRKLKNNYGGVNFKLFSEYYSKINLITDAVIEAAEEAGVDFGEEHELV